VNVLAMGEHMRLCFITSNYVTSSGDGELTVPRVRFQDSITDWIVQAIGKN